MWHQLWHVAVRPSVPHKLDFVPFRRHGLLVISLAGFWGGLARWQKVQVSLDEKLPPSKRSEKMLVRRRYGSCHTVTIIRFSRSDLISSFEVLLETPEGGLLLASNNFFLV